MANGDDTTGVGKFLAGGLTVAAAAFAALGVSGGVINLMLLNARGEMVLWASLIGFGVFAGLIAGLTKPADQHLDQWGRFAFAGVLLAIIGCFIIDLAFLQEATPQPKDIPGPALGGIAFVIWLLLSILVAYVLGTDKVKGKAPTMLGLLAVSLLAFFLGIGGMVALAGEVSQNHTRPSITASLTDTDKGALKLDVSIKAANLSIRRHFMVCIEGVNDQVDAEALTAKDLNGSLKPVVCGVSSTAPDQYMIYETNIDAVDTGKIDYTNSLRITPRSDWDRLRIRLEPIAENETTPATSLSTTAPTPPPPGPVTTTTIAGLPTAAPTEVPATLCRGDVLDDFPKTCALINLPQRSAVRPRITAQITSGTDTSPPKVSGAVTAVESTADGPTELKLWTTVVTVDALGQSATIVTGSAPPDVVGTMTQPISTSIAPAVTQVLICAAVADEQPPDCNAQQKNSARLTLDNR